MNLKKEHRLHRVDQHISFSHRLKPTHGLVHYFWLKLQKIEPFLFWAHWLESLNLKISTGESQSESLGSP